MKNPYILAYKHPPLARLTGFFAGLLMAIGFCLQNARLIPSLPGEYQPSIFLAGCLLGLITWGTSRAAGVACIALVAGLLSPIVIGWLTSHTQPPDIITLLRLLVGPIMCIGVAAGWQKIEPRWLWGIMCAYLLFALIGMLSPDTTAQMLSTLDIRINSAANKVHLPWSAFFYSEFSYAALAFITLYCWINARPEMQNFKLFYSSMTLLLLLATRSASAIPLILIVFLSQVRWRWLLFLPAFLIATYFISPRIAILVNASVQILYGNVGDFIRFDSSTAWRFISNMMAFQIIQANPLGTLNIDLSIYPQIPHSSSEADQLINHWLTTNTQVEAQGIAFNYGLFGGWVSFISVISVYLYGCYRSFTRMPINASLALAMVGFYALFVQSALTSLTTWVILGIMLGTTRTDDL